ncbi:MAG: hypothetical protein HKN79_03415 [Flavobacteriales bacterium]|nr:hypothetical protein [Flavobacteriales bacterium]
MRVLLLFMTCGIHALGMSQYAIEHHSFKVNNLGQILTLSDEGLDLYSPEGRLMKHFSEDLLGEMSTIDRSSSLESLIFYKDIPGFQLVDNTLSPHAPLYDLNQAGYPNVTAVCISNDNSFWAYDAVQFEVFRFDENFEILERSGNLAVILGNDLQPISMSISGNKLYIADPQLGVVVFDYFANHLLTLPFDGKLSDMDVTDDAVYVSTHKSIIRSDKKGLLPLREADLPSEVQAFDVEKGKVYWGDGNIIHSVDLNSLFD